MLHGTQGSAEKLHVYVCMGIRSGDFTVLAPASPSPELQRPHVLAKRSSFSAIGDGFVSGLCGGPRARTET